MYLLAIISFFFFNDTATTEIYTLSLHDALPIFGFRSGLFVPMVREGTPIGVIMVARAAAGPFSNNEIRSEEHTSELQSHLNLVCRLLLEKKKKKPNTCRRIWLSTHVA